MLWPPAPAETSRPVMPGPTGARSSMTTVASPSQVSITAPQPYQAAAAACHWSVVVVLYRAGSNAGTTVGVAVAAVADPARAAPDGRWSCACLLYTSDAADD